jgi:ribosomal protein S18 acetylase RimI-like enzyme
MTDLLLQRAGPEDAAELATISKRAFDGDIAYGAPGPEPGGPPGYDSPDWQARVMTWHGATYFKIVSEGRLIGGAICFAQSGDRVHLGRVYLEPALQNQGLGRRAMALVMAEYPAARLWTLETPEWNQRTQHFYERVGFTKVRTDAEGCHYEMRVDAQQPSRSDGA